MYIIREKSVARLSPLVRDQFIRDCSPANPWTGHISKAKNTHRFPRPAEHACQTEREKDSIFGAPRLKVRSRGRDSWNTSSDARVLRVLQAIKGGFDDNAR